MGNDEPYVIVTESVALYPGRSWVDVGPADSTPTTWPTPYAILYRDELNRLWKERKNVPTDGTAR